MDRFLEYPKDFRAIASFLPGRSTGQCVTFFYLQQKKDAFDRVRRKQQLKKRRQQVGCGAEGGHSPVSDTHMSTPWCVSAWHPPLATPTTALV